MSVFIDGTASADSVFGGGYTATEAFDGNTGTRWSSSDSVFPHWIKYDLGSGVTKTIERITILPLYDIGYGGTSIRNFLIQGSNNDSDWVTLETVVDAVNSASLQTYNFVNSTPYRYYRLYITSSYRGDTYCTLFEIEGFETSAYISDTLNIDDSIYVINTSPFVSETINIEDTIIVSASNTDAKFASKIISINPLIFITDTNPIEIIKVDTTDPQNPTWVVKTITGITNAKDVTINKTGTYIYIAGNNGKVIKVEVADLANQTIFDLSDTDNILTLEHNENFGITYAGTDNVIGELYTIDERTEFLLDSNFICLSPINFKIDSNFNIVSAFKLDSDFTALSYQYYKMNSDFKCLTKETVPIISIDDIIPINLQDYQVFIDSVELEDTDLVLESISITHSVGEESRASFQLSRKHDQLNTTLEGVSSTITSQNIVEIKIDGVTEFSGKISELDCQYENDREYVTISALAEEKENKTNNITMSLPGLNSRLSLYDILIQNPKIYNPYVDPSNEDNPKKYKGIRVDLGTKIEQHSINLSVFDSNGNIADAIQEGTFNPAPNWTYFWSPTVKKLDGVVLNVKETTEEEDEIAKFDDAQRELPINERKPWLRTGIRIQQTLDNISEGIQETFDTISKTINELAPLDSIKFLYIGTSLAPVSEDLWDLKQATHWKQAVGEDSETGKISFPNVSPGFLEIEITELPSSVLHKYGHSPVAYTTYYKIGEAPFKEISVRNGIKISKPKLVDDQDGLYSIKDAGYDFRKYCKIVADLEYEKLKNINGDILPDTSCTFNITIDAYLYYALSLLTQINIDNTTQSNIYNNANGFPISIKSITITSNDRKVTIEADNVKSTKELEIINSEFPDEDDEEYNIPETRTLIALKSDMRTRLKIERATIENEQVIS